MESHGWLHHGNFRFSDFLGPDPESAPPQKWSHVPIFRPWVPPVDQTEEVNIMARTHIYAKPHKSAVLRAFKWAQGPITG
eukprot:12402687-Karenia_brevis.AAC.1